MDWDHIYRNAAQTGSFVGRGTKAEDAYFAAFAGTQNAHWPTSAAMYLRRFFRRPTVATSYVAVVK